MGITHIHDRHSPPPRSDLTTHTIISTLQTRNDSTTVVPHQAGPARYHFLGKGYEQTQPALTLVQGTVIGRLSKYGLETPQLNLVQNPQLEESTEPGRGAESYPISCTDLLTHTAPPLPCTPFTQFPHQDTDAPQHSLTGKYQQIESARWGARHQPFGDGYGHTDTPLALMREESHGVQYLTSQKLYTQTIHPIRDREAQLSHQAGTLHTEKYTLNQHHHIASLAPRFYPVGGSFTHQPQEEYGCEKGPTTPRIHTQRKTTLPPCQSNSMESLPHYPKPETYQEMHGTPYSSNPQIP